MSFRNTFITDFIYQASDDVIDANHKVTEALMNHGCTLEHEVDNRGYGFYAGRIGTSGGSVEELQLPQLIRELENSTKVPFRLTILCESGPQLTYEIKPNQVIR